ncbi:MAG: recombinase family protein, partial [Erysipelotrichaceae bacterium]|nr:recombinase family protein [Erysipelotrichaceae bacterium]
IEELDTERQKQLKLVADLTANSVSSSQIDSITGYLQNWDEVSFDDKQRVVDTLISKIEATSIERVIHWKI